MLVLGYSFLSDSLQPYRTVARQALPPVEFFRQEFWSGVPFLPPGDLPDPGIKPAYLASLTLAGGFFTTAPLSEVQVQHVWTLFQVLPPEIKVLVWAAIFT